MAKQISVLIVTIMGISDIITLVSLIIAILAILNEKNRKSILLKFHLVDYILFCVAFLLINYFVFYNAFYSRGYYLPVLYFQRFGFSYPGHWAYIITILTLIYFFYKIWKAFYPYSKIKKVIKYYQGLIESNETLFLLDLLERYHKHDIIRLINETKDYEQNRNWWEYRFEKKSFKLKIKDKFINTLQFIIPSSWYNKRIYARMILHNIVDNPAFLALGSNQQPYFFADIFSSFKEIKRDGFPDETVNAFLDELLKHKNFWLKKELKESTKNDPTQPAHFYEENRILSSLLRDLSVADVNEIWRPFGEAALTEIEEEKTKGYDSKLYNEYSEDGPLWEYNTYQSIQFFYLLINEAITKKYQGSHFFLFYYDRIVDAILKSFEKRAPENFEDLTTIYHKFIDIIIHRSFYWLELSNKKNHPGIYHSILDCIGTNIDQITKSPYYGEERKISALNSFLEYYCDIESNEHAEDLRLKYEEKLLRPSMLTKKDGPYYTYITTAWDRFDKIPHRSMQGHGADLPYFARLKERVIIPLGLDPDAY